MSFAAKEAALLDWIATACGIAALWAIQGGTRPTVTHATLRVTSLVVNPLPEIRRDYDTGRDLGEEIRVQAVWPGDLTLGVQVYSTEVRGDGSAYAVLQKARVALGLPSVRIALADEGLGHFDSSPTSDLSAIIRAGWESRAACDFMFHWLDVAEEFQGYIARVEGEASIYPGPVVEDFEAEAP